MRRKVWSVVFVCVCFIVTMIPLRVWAVSIPPVEGNKWIKLQADCYVTIGVDGTVTVPYHYHTDFDKVVQQVSVLITDKAYSEADANVFLSDVVDIGESDELILNDLDANGYEVLGEGTFTLPGVLLDKEWGVDYHVYILAESIIYGCASAPYEITNVVEQIARVEVVLAEPEVGSMLATSATCNTTGVATNTPVISWSPDDITAGYHTSYTANITLSADTGYDFADLTSVVINGSVTRNYNRNTDGTLSVQYAFGATEKDKLISITTPQAMMVENRTSYEAMNLPTEVTITTEGGTASTADVSWNTTTPASGSYDPALLTEQTVTLTGTVTCPDSIDVNGVSLSTSITITIKAADTEDVPPTYTITVMIGEDGKLIIIGSGVFSKFVGVKVDGTLLDAKNYTATEGSTIVTLEKDYFDTLSVGTHIFEIVWTDGTASKSFVRSQNISDEGSNDNASNSGNHSMTASDDKNGNEKENISNLIQVNAPKTGDNDFWGRVKMVFLLSLLAILR